MKKITQIKKVYCQAVTSYLKKGWSLYGCPVIPRGKERPYQCMVKYAANEDEEKIVDYILLHAKATRDIDREMIYPNICIEANKYIELGYQPYGAVIERQDTTGWSQQYLAMVKYE